MWMPDNDTREGAAQWPARSRVNPAGPVHSTEEPGEAPHWDVSAGGAARVSPSTSGGMGWVASAGDVSEGLQRSQRLLGQSARCERDHNGRSAHAVVLKNSADSNRLKSMGSFHIHGRKIASAWFKG
jgi:hypothetical protein